VEGVKPLANPPACQQQLPQLRRLGDWERTCVAAFVCASPIRTHSAGPGRGSSCAPRTGRRPTRPASKQPDPFSDEEIPDTAESMAELRLSDEEIG